MLAVFSLASWAYTYRRYEYWFSDGRPTFRTVGILLVRRNSYGYGAGNGGLSAVLGARPDGQTFEICADSTHMWTSTSR